MKLSDVKYPGIYSIECIEENDNYSYLLSYGFVKGAQIEIMDFNRRYLIIKLMDSKMTVCREYTKNIIISNVSVTNFEKFEFNFFKHKRRNIWR